MGARVVFGVYDTHALAVAGLGCEGCVAHQGVGHSPGEDPDQGLQDVGRDGEGGDAADVDAEGLGGGVERGVGGVCV